MADILSWKRAKVSGFCVGLLLLCTAREDQMDTNTFIEKTKIKNSLDVGLRQVKQKNRFLKITHCRIMLFRQRYSY